MDKLYIRKNRDRKEDLSSEQPQIASSSNLHGSEAVCGGSCLPCYHTLFQFQKCTLFFGFFDDYRTELARNVVFRILCFGSVHSLRLDLGIITNGLGLRLDVWFLANDLGFILDVLVTFSENKKLVN